MSTEFRRMFLTGPEQGRWEDVPGEQAECILAPPAAGVGAVGDARADPSQYWETREDGGQWSVVSYWTGAADWRVRVRLLVIERLENDARRLNERAQSTMDGAGASVEGYRQQIAAAEAGLKQALADEKGALAVARDLKRQALDLADQIKTCRRELAGVRSAPAAEAFSGPV